MATMAEIAAQYAQQQFGNQQQQQQVTNNRLQQAAAARPAPISFEDWQEGAYDGKELSAMGNARGYYDNWRNKYNEAGTAGRNQLLQNHGLQFQNPYGDFGWGWQAEQGIDPMAGYGQVGQGGAGDVYSLQGSSRGESNMAGSPYGGSVNMTGPGGYLNASRNDWRGRLGGMINRGATRLGNAANDMGMGQSDAGMSEQGQDAEQEAGLW